MNLHKIVNLARSNGLITPEEYDDAYASIANPRRQRIEKLLYDLRYELSVGVLKGEISERLAFRFAMPSRTEGVIVWCEFHTDRRFMKNTVIDPEMIDPNVILKERE